MISEKRKLEKLEEELESTAEEDGETGEGMTEEQKEKAQERLEEGLDAGEKWAEDFVEISEKLEDLPGEPTEAVKHLEYDERRRFVGACTRLYIF